MASSADDMKYKPGRKAGDVKKGATGWCVFCDMPVNAAEYRADHYGGRCQQRGAAPAVKPAAAAEAPAVSKAELEARKYDQLSKDAPTWQMASCYATQAQQLRDRALSASEALLEAARLEAAVKTTGDAVSANAQLARAHELRKLAATR
jgi:hypothetical protein